VTAKNAVAIVRSANVVDDALALAGFSRDCRLSIDAGSPTASSCWLHGKSAALNWNESLDVAST